MKEFMFFIRKHDNSSETLSPVEFRLFLKACEVYVEGLKKEGKLISTQPIEWSGKIISGKEGSWKDVSFDGKGEVIGGYYHILAKDIEEATEIAKANPEFSFNKNTLIEVRPVKMKEEDTGFVYPGSTK